MKVAHLSLNLTVQRVETVSDFVYDASKPYLIDAYYNTSGKHPAVIGGKYDSDSDDFIPLQTYASWTFNKTSWEWEPPVEKPTPDDGKRCVWNEDTTSWDQVTRADTEPR